MIADKRIMIETINALLDEAAKKTEADSHNGLMNAGMYEDYLKRNIDFYRCGCAGTVPEDWLATYKAIERERKP